MATVGANLRERGYPGAALWVLKENHQARRFYEHLGGREAGGREDVRGEHILAEVAYGWSNLEVFGHEPAASD